MNRQVFLALFLTMLSFIIVPCHSNAADGVALSIAIVDVDKILNESKAAKSLQAQVKAKKEAFQKEFSQKETELKSAETDLIAQKEKLSAEEFSKKRKTYEEKIIETRKLFQKRRNSLDEGISKAMVVLRKGIVDATSQIAESKKYEIVLTREGVLIADKALDITPEVLAKLDSIQGDIKLSIE